MLARAFGVQGYLRCLKVPCVVTAVTMVLPMLLLSKLNCLFILQAAMEVVVTEEKKKIFRARKTMKISDRQQLDSLHTTLLTAPSAVSETPQPVMNGTHKEEEQKVADKELNNVLDSNSPSTTRPPPSSQSAPAPLPTSTTVNSQSPKAKDDTSPTSPFHSLNIELKKMQEDEKEENEKKGSSKSQTNKTFTPPPSKETSAKDLKVKQEKGRKEVNL